MFNIAASNVLDILLKSFQLLQMEAKPDKPDGKECDGTTIVYCFIFILFAILFIVLGLFIYERYERAKVSLDNKYLL